MKLTIDILAKLRGNIDNWKNNFSKLKKYANTAHTPISDLQKKLDTLINIRGNATSLEKIRELNGLIGKTRREITKLENLPPKSFSDRIGEATQKYKTLLTVAAGGAAVSTVRKSLGLALDAEQAQTAYSVLLQDKKKAVDLLSDMDLFAAKTPFQKTDLVEAGQSLLGFGLKSQQLLPIMGKLGDLSQGNANKFKSLVDNYGKLVSAQRGNTMDLNQFAIAGVPIWAELGKMMNKSGVEVRKYVEQNGVSVDLVNTAISRLTAQGGQFFGLMNEQSKTGAGQWSNMLDALEQLGTKIGNLLLPAFKALTTGLSWVIDKVNIAVDFLEKNKEIFALLSIAMTPVILKYAYLTGSIIKNTAATKIAALMQNNLASATKAGNLATLANPYALAIAGVLALSYAVWKLVQAKRASMATQVNLSEIQGKANADTLVEQARVQRLSSIVKNNAHSLAERKTALEELKNIAPEYFEKLDVEKSKTEDITNAVSLYTQALLANAEKKIKMEILENDPFLAKKKEKTNDIAYGKGNNQYNLVDGTEQFFKNAKKSIVDGKEVYTDEYGNKREFSKKEGAYGDARSQVYNNKDLQKSIAIQVSTNEYLNEYKKLANQLGLDKEDTKKVKPKEDINNAGGNLGGNDMKNSIVGGGQKSITIYISKVIENQNLVAQQAKEIPEQVANSVYPAILQIFYKAGLVTG